MKNSLPPVFEIYFEESMEKGKLLNCMTHEGKRIGPYPKDAMFNENGYSYEECAHFSYLTHMGTSSMVDIWLNDDAACPSEKMILRATFEHSLPIMASKMREVPHYVRQDEPQPLLLNMMHNIAKASRIDPVPSVEVIAAVLCDFYKNADLLRHNRGGSLICDTVNKTVTYKEPVFV